MINQVLVTDVSGRPVGMTTWVRSVALMMGDKAYPIVEDDSKEIKSEKLSIPAPLIIQLKGYVPLIENPKWNKRVLAARDNYECQYCGTRLTPKTATIDHIKPKHAFKKEGLSEAEATTYENCVLACAKCNSRKGNRLPYECKMYPKKTPRIPSYVQTMWYGKHFHPIQAQYIADYHPKQISLDDLNIIMSKSLEII